MKYQGAAIFLNMSYLSLSCRKQDHVLMYDLNFKIHKLITVKLD